MTRLDCDLLQLALVPGPPPTSEIEFSSDSELLEIVQLEPAVVAAALLGVSGVEPTTTDSPVSWTWEARLVTSDADLRFAMTLLEPDLNGPYWGGFSLHGRATVVEICRVAHELRDSLGSIWIHDGECVMRTLEAFREAYAGS